MSLKDELKVVKQELSSDEKLLEQAFQLEKFYNKLQKLDWVDSNIIKRDLKLIAEKSAIYYKKDVDLNFIYDIQGLPLPKYKVLKEALLHLIRNSISHGIEDSKTRLDRGKDKTGRINIHLYEEDKNYVLRYSDDGSGFDFEKIRKIAIEKGLIKNSEKINDKDLINLIFEDGFSVKSEIDAISGTGVGMSVVKNNILYLLRGKINIKNRSGEGISILIKFPK